MIFFSYLRVETLGRTIKIKQVYDIILFPLIAVIYFLFNAVIRKRMAPGS